MNTIIRDEDLAFLTDAQIEEELRIVALHVYERFRGRAKQRGVCWKGGDWPCLQSARLDVILRGVSLLREALAAEETQTEGKAAESPAKPLKTSAARPPEQTGLILPMSLYRPLLERLRIRLCITAKEAGLLVHQTKQRTERLAATNEVLLRNGLQPVKSWSELGVAGFNLLLDEISSGRLVWTDAPSLAETEVAA